MKRLNNCIIGKSMLRAAKHFWGHHKKSPAIAELFLESCDDLTALAFGSPVIAGAGAVAFG